jgi:hypothetical protein
MCSRFTALSRHQVVEVPPGAIRSAARSHLHALIGDVTLKPIDGVLWAHPTPNAKGLTEVRPLDGLSINSPKMVAGAGFQPATHRLGENSSIMTARKASQ